MIKYKTKDIKLEVECRMTNDTEGTWLIQLF